MPEGQLESPGRTGLLGHAELVAQEFDLDTAGVCAITAHFRKVMQKGLAEGNAYQIPSYVTSVPTGSEEGVFLAVDLGGTHCRVCAVRLKGDSTYTIKQKKHTVARDLRMDSRYEPLFDFVAVKVRDLLEEDLGNPANARGVGAGVDGLSVGSSTSSSAPPIQLGFTFSFTCDQESLSIGRLVHWDKGWDIPDAIGKDPCALLQQAIDRIDVDVEVSALANDSVGALMARAYTSGATHSGGTTTIGAIFGTGTNAAYIERLENVAKFHDQKAEPSKTDQIMVLNTEWGCFDEQCQTLPVNQYDRSLDAASPIPSDQMFEKRVGGLYLGELLRLAIERMMREGLFDMTVDETSPLFQREAIESSFLSLIGADTSGEFSRTRDDMATTLKAQNVSLDDARALRLIADAIGRRAARLSGASLAAVILTTGASPPKEEVESPQRGSERTQAVNSSSLSSAMAGFVRPMRRILSKTLRHPTPVLASSVLSNGTTDQTQSPNKGLSVDIGLDGSVAEFSPGFADEIRRTLAEVPEIGPTMASRVRMGLVRDGSALGAALMAQAALRT